MWVKLPEVAVTVSVYVPAGVPGDGVGVKLLPPPPHAGIDKVASMAAVSRTAANPARTGTMLTRRRSKTNAAPTSATIRASHPTGKLKGAGGERKFPGTTVPRALVMTLTVASTGVVPFSESEAGETVHVASAGAPVHARATVPVNPSISPKVSV